tara:strand:- start:164 stop:412 length:249 start_codon:yes stop_codon:yes gene_type:complete
MGIFNTIGSLTYKTQRILTRTFADPVNDLKQGYTMAKQTQNLADAKTKAIYDKGTSNATGQKDLFGQPVTDEFTQVIDPEQS